MAIPEQLLPEILAWLPVKSLSRFRCVSKSWNSLITDPHFMKLHTFKSTHHNDVFHQRRRLVITDGDHYSLYSIDLNEFLNRIDLDNVDDGIEIVASKLEYPRDELYYNCVQLVFCCNGLLLFHLTCGPISGFCVLNPATRECKLLPKRPELVIRNEEEFDVQVSTFYSNTRNGRGIPYVPGNNFNGELYGFGFDSSSLDYKMVYGELFDGKLMFCVYSLKGSCWRVISRHYPYAFVTCKSMSGRVLNGGVHWLVNRDYTSSTVALLCFGFGDEEAREVQLPCDLEIGDGDYLLSIVDECLCLGKNGDREVWIMKEYGVRESWTKISIPIAYSRGLHSGFLKRNHELLLLEDRNQLVMYDHEKERFHSLSIRGIPRVGSVGIYSEGFVSPYYYPNFG